MPNHDDIKQMKKHLYNAQKVLEHLSTETIPYEKQSDMLEAIVIQFELTTIEMRKLCERNRIPVTCEPSKDKILHSKEVYGEIETTENGWFHICLNTLLPSCKLIENSYYISDSISRLLDGFVAFGGELPFYEKAFMAIIERCNLESRHSFDHDNKGFKAVQNALKGRLFADDNQFELSLGLFSELDDENACHIYVMPEREAADFFYQRYEEGL